MPTTKYRLAEQVMRLVKGGDQKAASSLHIREVIELTGQTINAKLKLQHFEQTMGQGERIPVGTMLATYENIPVESYAGQSRAILPAAPIELPRGLGVYQVSPYNGDTPDLKCQYIPVPAGQFWMIQEEGLISDLLGMVGYERYGLELLFTRDVTQQTPAVTKVLIRMAIADLSKLSDDAILPIPAKLERDVIADVYQVLTGQKPRLNIVDPAAENKGGTE